MISLARRRSTDAGSLQITSTAWQAYHCESQHQHTDSRVVVVVAGTFHERCGLTVRDCGPGSAIYRLPGELHSDTYSRDGGLYVSIALPTDAYAQPQLQEVRRDRSFHVRSGAVQLLASRLAAEIAAPDQWSALALHGLVLDVLAEMGRRSSPSMPRKPPWIDEVCSLLHDDRRSTWTLAAAAAVAGVAPAQLGRIFRKHVGVGLAEYQRSLRVDEARRLLESSNRSIADIAAVVGFCDQSHLNRSFRRVLGVTPDFYRRTAAQPYRPTGSDSF